MDLDPILSQGDETESVVNSEEQELRMYISKYSTLLKAREANNGSALSRLMRTPLAKKLGEETARRLLIIEGICG